MDKKNLFGIGEVAKMFHLSVSSLRHYENIGLLKPEYIAPGSGYRYYGTELKYDPVSSGAGYAACRD